MKSIEYQDRKYQVSRLYASRFPLSIQLLRMPSDPKCENKYGILAVFQLRVSVFRLPTFIPSIHKIKFTFDSFEFVAFSTVCKNTVNNRYDYHGDDCGEN